MTNPPNDQYPVKPGKRPNLFLIAYKNFPGSLFATIIGIALWGSPFLYSYFHGNGANSAFISVLLVAAVMTVIPLVIVYLVSLIRARKVREGLEIDADLQLAAISDDLVALQAKEIQEENEVLRLEQVVEGEIQARKVKDEKEDERWDLLTESLREQKEIVELASEERLLVAQQVKEIKDEGEVIRKGLVSDDLEARHVKDLKEDKRWDVLNESLRLQNETVELASEERIIVAQQVKDLKEEGEIMRKGLASDDLEARNIKESKDEKRWAALHERLRIQEERSEERDRQQVLRDKEYVRMRNENEIKEQYKVLFSRYIRNAQDNGLSRKVADGLASIPDVWLREQPEILKNPALMLSIQQYNER
jgi:hypothetical protein